MSRLPIAAALAAAVAAGPSLAQEPGEAPACERSRFASDAYSPAPAFEGQTDAPAAAPSAFAVETLASPFSLTDACS
jgi:hypothetical protein